jgi:hypothetical protein
MSLSLCLPFPVDCRSLLDFFRLKFAVEFAAGEERDKFKDSKREVLGQSGRIEGETVAGIWSVCAKCSGIGLIQ